MGIGIADRGLGDWGSESEIGIGEIIGYWDWGLELGIGIGIEIEIGIQIKNYI